MDKMDQESEVDLSNLAITPLWRKRRSIPKLPNTRSLNRRSRSRPSSYQIDGILVTDFPVDGNVPTRNGNVPPDPDGRPLLQRQPSTHSLPTPDKPHLVLSTNSTVSLKNGTQQIIPKDLASGIKIKNHHQNNQILEVGTRSRRVQSMVEPLTAPLVPKRELGGDMDPELESPGQLRRGLRSTSYRRAVVSGIHFDKTSSLKTNNRRSQPNLKTVLEDKEKFCTLGRGKEYEKKQLPAQGPFDGEENAVLYQNYKEKALTLNNGDSDEDSDQNVQAEGQKSDDRIIVQFKPIRCSWSQLSVVKKSGILQTVTQEEKKRQEAIFEVISSEHSYMLSLEILIRMFKDSDALNLTMTKTERHHLFSNIVEVYKSSNKFFKELEARYQQNALIPDISDIVEKHATSTFDPYVTYCSNEVYQQRTLQKLLNTNPSFKEILTRIEAHPECRNLPMISFLILPMQRVTRLPLLMDTICQKTPKESPENECTKKALQAVSKLVRQCNEGARRMERTEMMYTINSQLEFKIKPFPLVSSSRWLSKRGELMGFVEDTGIFSKRMSKQQVYFFLFNDVLIVTKKKSEDSYSVTDYAMRDLLQVEPCEAEELNLSPMKTAPGMLYSRQSSFNHLFRLTMLSNHAGEKVVMVFGAESPSDCARWFTALGQKSAERQHPDRTTLTQVEITRTYPAKQPDELSLQVADVVLLYQSVEDGWYEGERLRDAEIGWFPMECAKVITCQATISKNMQRMGRLLGVETNV
ncbi:rho guanine nucleotide exchange factor 26-like isoform X1 [Scyliorhinus canicula]|uniref:rho guanine nucleotide exchange factor 26-like isoform X1 n=1 Tax=Scyliorhinus canicula TaxID=7830 RepID=UPI0018F6105E|nr:rho guanine nucleotide exchange factor 26-like isoform X1 [Scyliorhinus canicula]XP_038672194.1 rho guanine nucleotide exchange factor 26-like isoform X1 [Scyliorhinus canicula]XP_038672195.1 rho guanine nucleotide exchange factor 26-like isoform X1 [Scyliorhinus canicula]XP_038672196.1 rho guanine nucleotide exchange factor 26-like isoform X1 [Scyliorhinus canicula]XP_038672198.1 rho guanine nucleotide exchange factor 26-like isoform X1 [Scyliorhinus canicula]